MKKLIKEWSVVSYRDQHYLSHRKNHLSIFLILILIFVLLILFSTNCIAGDLFDEIERGNLQGVKELLDKGADVNMKNQFGETPLMKAAVKPDLAMVKFLIERYADVNAKNEKGGTALMYAASQPGSTGVNEQCAPVVKLLLDKGADVNARTDNGWSALLQAAFNYNHENVRLFLNKGADVSVRDEEGSTPLYHASWGCPECVKLLLDKGADVDARVTGISAAHGDTALINASRHCNRDIVKILLGKNPHVNARNSLGQTALNIISGAQSEKRDCKEVIALLKKSGARDDTQVDLRDVENNTIWLIAACRDGSTDTVKFLLDKGVDVNGIDYYGSTALIAASQGCQDDIVKMLLKKNANVNVENTKGETALTTSPCTGTIQLLRNAGGKGKALENAIDMEAYKKSEAAAEQSQIWEYECTEGSVETVKQLLDEGLDVNARDTVGATPLMVASQRCRDDIVKLLIERGADVNARIILPGSEGLDKSMMPSALTWAKQQGEGCMKTVQLLIKAGAKE